MTLLCIIIRAPAADGIDASLLSLHRALRPAQVPIRASHAPITLFPLTFWQLGNTRFFGLFAKSAGRPFSNVQMSERYRSLVTPAGYAFSIWAVIYLWEMAGNTYIFLYIYIYIYT